MNNQSSNGGPDLAAQIKQAIYEDPTTPHKPGFDPSGLMAKIDRLCASAVAPDSPSVRTEPDIDLPGVGDFPGNFAYVDGGPQGEMPALRKTSDPYGDPETEPRA